MNCKNYIKIVNGVIADIGGEFKEGAYMICLDCKVISKKNGCYKAIYDLTTPKPVNYEEESND